MIYGYARVSTKGQARDGNSLEAQTKALKEAGAEMIFSDSFTGTKIDRPEFDKLKNRLSCGDKLIVTKLDRFARSASQGSCFEKHYRWCRCCNWWLYRKFDFSNTFLSKSKWFPF